MGVRRSALSDNIGRMDAITMPPAPVNEPNLTYAPGSPERDAARAAELNRQEAAEHRLTATIGGEQAAGRRGARSPSCSRTTTSTCSAC